MLLRSRLAYARPSCARPRVAVRPGCTRFGCTRPGSPVGKRLGLGSASFVRRRARRGLGGWLCSVVRTCTSCGSLGGARAGRACTCCACALSCALLRGFFVARMVFGAHVNTNVLFGFCCLLCCLEASCSVEHIVTGGEDVQEHACVDKPYAPTYRGAVESWQPSHVDPTKAADERNV